MGGGGGICGQLVWREQVCGASSSPPSGAIASCRVVRSREADQPTLTHTGARDPPAAAHLLGTHAQHLLQHPPLHPCLTSQPGQESGPGGQIWIEIILISPIIASANSSGC